MATATMAHARKAGMCSRGMRQFAEERNLDWDDFLQNGISTEQLRSLDDEMANQVAGIAEEEASNGQG